MKANTNQGIETMVVTWTSDEARTFFAYLDQVAAQPETTKDEDRETASSQGKFLIQLKPHFA